MAEEQFVQSCQRGAAARVAAALAAGQEANSRDQDRNTGLMLAICYRSARPWPGAASLVANQTNVLLILNV